MKYTLTILVFTFNLMWPWASIATEEANNPVKQLYWIINSNPIDDANEALKNNKNPIVTRIKLIKRSTKEAGTFKSFLLN